MYFVFFFFFSSRRRHTRYIGDWSSDVCSSDLQKLIVAAASFAGSLPPASVGSLISERHVDRHLRQVRRNNLTAKCPRWSPSNNSRADRRPLSANQVSPDHHDDSARANRCRQFESRCWKNWRSHTVRTLRG